MQYDYSIPELCKLLHICRNTAYLYLKNGKFPGAFQVGVRRSWRVPREDVVAFAKKYNLRVQLD